MKKLILMLIMAIMIFIFPMLPVTPALAEESAVTGQVAIVAGMVVNTSLATAGTVSSGVEARDAGGNSLPVTDGGKFSLLLANSEGKVILPVTLGELQTLNSFTDPANGLELANNKFTLSLKDSSGINTLSISGDVFMVAGNGKTTEITVENLQLKSEQFTVDLTSTNPKIGEVEAYFQANLKSLPKNASVKVTVTKDPQNDPKAAFQLAVIDEGNKIADIACTMNIEKTNLVNGTDLGEATIIMKAGRAWAEAYGLENISIMRYSEEGITQKLPTTFEGYEGDNAVFQAISPDGLSVFGLAAITELPAESYWIFVFVGIGGSIVLAGIIIYFIIRRRKLQDANLSGKWPTGTKPEDWV